MSGTRDAHATARRIVEDVLDAHGQSGAPDEGPTTDRPSTGGSAVDDGPATPSPDEAREGELSPARREARRKVEEILARLAAGEAPPTDVALAPPDTPAASPAPDTPAASAAPDTPAAGRASEASDGDPPPRVVVIHDLDAPPPEPAFAPRSSPAPTHEDAAGSTAPAATPASEATGAAEPAPAPDADSDAHVEVRVLRSDGTEGEPGPSEEADDVAVRIDALHDTPVAPDAEAAASPAYQLRPVQRTRPRTWRWVVVTLLAAVALTVLLPMAVDAVRGSLSL